MKTLAIFCDGTWNKADQASPDGKPTPTNIVKLFESVLPVDADGNPQIIHYVRGIGTRKSERFTGGWLGWGISENIQDAYRFLVSNYEENDKIFIFGFSRGAYTARSLAGMIRNFSLLKRDNLHLIEKAFGKYKNKSDEWRPNGMKAVKFRKQFSWDEVPIHFLGVFDTVGALGAPFGILWSKIVGIWFPLEFHDTQLSRSIKSAYHAVSVDERRLVFQPTLMKRNDNHHAANFEEKWFPGVHSNIGGGYLKTGLSDVALDWMAQKAGERGLNLNLKKHHIFECNPDFRETPEKSQTLLYRIATILFVKLPSCIGLVLKNYRNSVKNTRWNGDYIRQIPNAGNVGQVLKAPPGSTVPDYHGDLHSSVLKKIRDSREPYHPPNVI